MRRFNQVLLYTAFGQSIDVTYENYKRVTEEDVMRVHHYKTANYTVVGPLQYGALFAGASEKEIKKRAEARKAESDAILENIYDLLKNKGQKKKLSSLKKAES